jgi:ATP adenylyltransferase
MAYLGEPPTSGCIFCTARDARRDPARYVLHRGRRAFALLNLYPYSNGHLMVAPYLHLGALEDLPRATLTDVMALAQRSVRALRKAFNPQGFNLGVNLGQAAGAGVTDHVHLHVVPRWHGDTNFMPVLADTKVMPDHLRNTYRNLRANF